jgi:tetratricopeptide (TPR) repeat protein
MNEPYSLWISLLRTLLAITDADSNKEISSKLELLIEDSGDCLAEDETFNFSEILPILGLLLGLEGTDPRLSNPDPLAMRGEIIYSFRLLLKVLAFKKAKLGSGLIIVLERLDYCDEASQYAFSSILNTLSLKNRIAFIITYGEEFEIDQTVKENSSFHELSFKADSENEDYLNQNKKNEIKDSLENILESADKDWFFLCDKSAINQYSLILDQYSQISDEQRILVQLKLGDIYLRIGKIDKAELSLKEALALSVKSEDENQIAETNLKLGLFFKSQGEYKKADSYFREAAILYKKLNRLNEYSDSLDEFGVLQLYSGHVDKAHQYFLKAFKIKKDIDDKRGLAITYNHLGTVLRLSSDFTNAIDHFNKFFEISKSLKDKNNMAMANNNLGVTYYVKGDLIKAVECYELIQIVKQDMGDLNSVMLVQDNIAIVKCDLGEYEAAIDLSLKVLDYSRKLGNKRSVCNVLGNLGNTYKSCGMLTEAIKVLDESIEISEEFDFKENFSESNLVKAETLLMENKVEDSERCLEKGINAAANSRYDYLIFRGELLKSRILITKIANEPDSFNDIVKLLKNMLKRFQTEQEKADIHYELMRAYSAVDDKDLMNKHKEEAQELYSSLYEQSPKLVYKERVEEMSL